MRRPTGYRLLLAGWLGTVSMILALASCRPGTGPVTTPEPAPPPPAATPPAPRPPPRLIAPLPPSPSEPTPAPAPTGPLGIRVGLASDLPAVDLPCCDGRLTLAAGGETVPLSVAMRVTPAGALAERAVYRLQMAALKDEQQARGLAERLADATGLPADAVFDAGTDLYRVRAGRFARRQEADAHRARLQALGLGDSWVATEGGDLEDPALEVAHGATRRLVPGRWLEISAPPGVGIPWGEARYRGRLLIFLNERAQLNVVNELELEDYLRGVVPKEMGPELYGELEALKAQTVAARTYAVRNLGEFAPEGFDICSTPRCQVYSGMAVEHPLSDRAIAETAGQVALFDSAAAETLYGATCGGHTENVEVVFPAKTGAYLRGVPCLEAGARQLQGDAAHGTPFPAALTRQLLPPAAGRPHRDLAERLVRLAGLAGVPVPSDRLKSMHRKEVMRFVASVYDLVLDRRLRPPREQLRSLLADPPPEWRHRDLELAAYLASSPLLAKPGDRHVSAAQAEELLLQLALYLGVLEHQEVRYLSLVQDRLEVRAGGRRAAYDLPDHLATFRPEGGALRAATLELMAGDALELYLHRGRLAALVQPVNPPAVHFGDRAPKRNWSRFISASKLKSAVQTRYPGFPFTGFEVLSRGVSGRVGKLRLLGEGGRTLEVDGLAIRWTLDVWDTLFWAEPTHGRGGEPGWMFRGRGWGHGVGMCQAGAYGMAVRGADYRAILEHYYTGIELGRLKPAPERPRFASGIPRSPQGVAEPARQGAKER